MQIQHKLTQQTQATGLLNQPVAQLKFNQFVMDLHLEFNTKTEIIEERQTILTMISHRANC